MKQLLHSQILGEGSPLLILHGFLGMSDNWKTLGNKYSRKGMQVHLIDQRNHGKSFWSDTFNYEVMADDLDQYMQEHGIGNAIVMGHSMGGKTAMQFACTRPEEVSKLIVADIAPKFYPPHHQEILEALKSLPLDEFESRTDADEYLSERIKDWGTRQFLLKNLSWEKDGSLGFKCNLQVLDEKYEEIGEAIGTGFTYDGPTLFLRGDRSEYISPADSDDIRKHFPKATVATIDNAGHWLHAENPKQYFDVSMNFIGEDQ